MADSDDSSPPSRQPYQQPHTYSPRCHTPSFGQRYSHQVSNGLQRLDTSMASSRINSSKRPATAHHTSYSGHLPTFPPNEFWLDHSNFQPSPSTALSTATSLGRYNNHHDQLPRFTSVQVPSHPGSSRRRPPSIHSQAQIMSVAPSVHPQSYLQLSTTYFTNDTSGGSMYPNQGQDQTLPRLNVNTASLPSPSQDGYVVQSSTNHYQVHSTVLSFDSDLPSPPLSPLSPLTPHFSNSHLPSSGSPTSTPSSISTPETRPSVGTVPHLPSSLTYPFSSIRPFRCKRCKLSFVRNYDLKRHKETHTGNRSHMCSACGKTYTRKDALTRHQLIKQCGKVSSRKKDD